MAREPLNKRSLAKNAKIVWICTIVIILFNVLKQFVFHYDIVLFDKIIMIVVVLCTIIMSFANLKFKE